jgi:hypothetical protein
VPAVGAGTPFFIIGTGLDPAAILFGSRAANPGMFAGEIVTTVGPPDHDPGIDPACIDHDVVKVIDPDVVPYPNLGANTSAPMFSNQFATNPLMRWSYANLGRVFGVTLRHANAPKIYVAASPVYGPPTAGWWGPGGSGCVYELDTGTGNIAQFAILPQSSSSPSGLGDVEWDRFHQRLFVSNFEDGRIYAYNALGALVQVYDPWNVGDANNDGSVPLDKGTRVWALRQYSKRVMLFSVWVRDSCNRTNVPTQGCLQTNNAIYACGIKANGDLFGPPLLVRVMDPIDNGWSNPVSDIEIKYGPAGWAAGHPIVIVAERGMCDPFGGPWLIGQARVMELGIFNAWQRRIDVSDVLTPGWLFPWKYTNSSGGATYDFKLQAWCTGDFLHQVGPDDFLHGLQRVPAPGNALDPTPTSKCMLIDVDAQTDFGWNAFENWQPGDVNFYPGF